MRGAHETGTLWKASHLAHAVTFLALLGTGMLLFSPTMRSRLVGGYSLHLRSIHCWTGLAFALATLPFVPHALRLARRARPGGSGATRGAVLRLVHALFALAAAAALTASGFVLWQRRGFSLALMDASGAVHLWLTYGAAAVFMLHLTAAAMARRAARDRTEVNSVAQSSTTEPLHVPRRAKTKGAWSCW
jgi:hypothetical protein